VSAALATAPQLRAHAGPTLSDVLVEAWNDLRAGARAECPVCAGAMQPRWTAGAGVAGGRCGDCGATLE
jgi:hypothetical protein